MENTRATFGRNSRRLSGPYGIDQRAHPSPSGPHLQFPLRLSFARQPYALLTLWEVNFTI
jgi:hypothetical protein